jgi:ABC-2 type transport system permease protein
MKTKENTQNTQTSKASMQTRNAIKTLFKREFTSFFTSPAAYIVIALFLIFSGVLFFSTYFLGRKAELRGFFSLLPILYSLFIPAITMRFFSEEKKSGSIETLMTLPVTSFQVVISKYLAAFASSAIMTSPTLFYVITIVCFGKPDAGPIIGGYLGALLLCSVYSAIGIFASSLTKNQIIAFFTALAISAFLTLIGMFMVFLPAQIVKVLSYISITSHFNSIAKGIIDSRDIIYFVSVTILFLVLTIKSQEKIGR